MEMNWIPVTEKLPEKYCKDGILYNHQTVITTLKNGHVCEMWWFGGYEEFVLVEGWKKQDQPKIQWLLGCQCQDLSKFIPWDIGMQKMEKAIESTFLLKKILKTLEYVTIWENIM